MQLEGLLIALLIEQQLYHLGGYLLAIDVVEELVVFEQLFYLLRGLLKLLGL